MFGTMLECSRHHLWVHLARGGLGLHWKSTALLLVLSCDNRTSGAEEPWNYILPPLMPCRRSTQFPIVEVRITVWQYFSVGWGCHRRHHHHHHQGHRHHQDKDHPNKVGVGLLAKKHLAAQLSVSLQRGNPQHPFAHMLLVPTGKLRNFIFYLLSFWAFTEAIHNILLPTYCFCPFANSKFTFFETWLELHWPLWWLQVIGQNKC